MADDNLIQVGATVNVSQLNSGMNEAAQTVKTSTAQVSQAFQDAAAKTDLAWKSVVDNFKNNLAQYNAALAQGGEQAKLFEQIVNEGVATNLTYAQSLAVASTAVQEMGTASEVAASQISTGMTNSFYKVSLLGHELGGRIPRAMEMVISHSPMLAGALNLAFPVLVAAGFLEIIERIPDVVRKWAEEMGGLTDSVKEQGKELAKLNGEWQDFNLKLQIQANHMGEDLLQGTSRLSAEQRDYNKDIDTYGKALQDAQKHLKDLDEQLNGTHKEVVAVNSVTGEGIEGDVANAVRLSKDQVKDLTAQWVAAQEKVKEYQQKIIELKQTTIPKVGGELGASEIADADKALKDAAKHQQEVEKNQQKSAEEMLKIRAEEAKSLDDSAAKESKNAAAALGDLAKENDATIAANNKKIQADNQVLDGEIQHADATQALYEKQLDFELQQGKISQSEHDRRLKESIQAEAAAVIQILRIKEAAYSQDSADYQRIEDQIQKVTDKANAKIEQSEQNSIKRREQQWQTFNRNLNSAINSSLTGWIQGTETLNQAWGKMADEMAIKFIQGLERQLVTFITTEATKDAVSAATHQKEGLRTAYSAAKHAYDSAADIPVIGPVVAPVIAAGAFAAVEAFGSAEGGQYIVPGPQLTMLHPQEMVLPADLAGRMRSVIDGGTGGTSGASGFVFAPTVHALDADGVDRVLTKHQKLFEARINKFLSRRGIKIK